MVTLGFILALCMGLILGLLGGGGSILTVPILVYFFDVSATLATGYSLFIVGVTSVIATFRYRQKNLLDIRVAILFSIPSIVGVLMSRLWILPKVPSTLHMMGTSISKDQLILLVFSLLILVIAFFMFKSKDPVEEETQSGSKTRLSLLFIGIEGFLVGIITGFVGAGGGFMIVPALTLFARLPLKKAIATSLLIISAKSIVGFLGDVVSGVVFEWQFLLLIVFMTLTGTVVGTQLSNAIEAHHLRRGFAYFIVVMGILIIVKELY